MKDKIPQFLLDEFKKNPRSIKMLNYPKEIIDFITEYAKFYNWQETDIKRIFKIMKQGVSEMPICEVDDCNKTVYVDYYAKVRKGCCHKHNTMITSMEKYGVTHITKTDEFQNTKKETIKEKYGSEHIFQSQYFKNKRNETMISKYGTTIAMHNAESLKKKMVNCVKTCEEKYNTKYITQTEIFKNRSKQTMLKKFGVEYSMQSDEVKNKSIQTSLKNFGVPNPSMHSKIRKQVKETMINKGLWCPDEMLTDLELYRRQVWIETRKQDINSLKYSEKRGVKGYHLDHRYSILEGFKNNILPSIIGNIKNLEFIPYFENCSKGRKCSVLLNEII